MYKTCRNHEERENEAKFNWFSHKTQYKFAILNSLGSSWSNEQKCYDFVEWICADRRCWVRWTNPPGLMASRPIQRLLACYLVPTSSCICVEHFWTTGLTKNMRENENKIRTCSRFQETSGDVWPSFTPSKHVGV